MARKFPKSVRVTFKPTAGAGLPGHAWAASSTDGAFLAEGWSAGSKRDARDEAWHALEQIGLVTDGVES